jgi:folate-binding protein YgfZ
MNLAAEYVTQYSALTRGVGFAALTGRTILSITGSDRISFLNAFCTNNVKALQPGSGCEAFITNPQGKTLGHVLIFCEQDQLVLDTAPGQAGELIAHFDKYVISEDVQFVDRTSDLCDILVAGSTAAEMLASLASSEVPTDLLSHIAVIITGMPAVVRRVEYAGPASFFVQSPIAGLSEMQQSLTAAGAAGCDAAAVESARLEAGFPLFGRDITSDNLPQEIGRDARAISFTKGCYLGQETVARIDALGHVNRQLVGLKFVSEMVPPDGTALLANEKEVGQITSAAWSPALEAPLALGMVRRAHMKPGTQLMSAGGMAEVIPLPINGR